MFKSRAERAERTELMVLDHAAAGAAARSRRGAAAADGPEAVPAGANGATRAQWTHPGAQGRRQRPLRGSRTRSRCRDSDRERGAMPHPRGDRNDRPDGVQRPVDRLRRHVDVAPSGAERSRCRGTRRRGFARLRQSHRRDPRTAGRAKRPAKRNVIWGRAPNIDPARGHHDRARVRPGSPTRSTPACA